MLLFIQLVERFRDFRKEDFGGRFAARKIEDDAFLRIIIDQGSRLSLINVQSAFHRFGIVVLALIQLAAAAGAFGFAV